MPGERHLNHRPGQYRGFAHPVHLVRDLRKALPIGAIEIYNEVPHVCDLCGGSPRCVEACEMDAIRLEPDIRQSVSLAGIKGKTKKLSPSRKRYAYALEQSASLRESWLADRSNS